MSRAALTGRAPAALSSAIAVVTQIQMVLRPQ